MLSLYSRGARRIRAASDADQVFCLLRLNPCGPRAHAIPRPGGCELAARAARRAPRLRGCAGSPAAVARCSRFLADTASSSPAALEAVMGAPLVRQSENRVYASAALSFSTCMVVRALLRITCHAFVPLSLRSRVLRRPARRGFHRFSAARVAARCAAEEDAVKDRSWALRVQRCADAPADVVSAVCSSLAMTRHSNPRTLCPRLWRQGAPVRSLQV